VVAPSAKTVAALLEEWLSHIEHLGRSPSTLFGYRRLVGQLPDGFKAVPLKKVIIDDLYRFLAEPVSRKPATVLRFHTVLRAAFAQAVRWGWVQRNPVDRASPPLVHRYGVSPPTVEDVLRILERALNSRNPENALVFASSPPPAAGEARCAPSNGRTSISTPTRCGLSSAGPSLRSRGSSRSKAPRPTPSAR